jgi:hypothetical protein
MASRLLTARLNLRFVQLGLRMGRAFTGKVPGGSPLLRCSLHKPEVSRSVVFLAFAERGVGYNWAARTNVRLTARLSRTIVIGGNPQTACVRFNPGAVWD